MSTSSFAQDQFKLNIGAIWPDASYQSFVFWNLFTFGLRTKAGATNVHIHLMTKTEQ